jgi:hypothetical protein
VQQATHSKALDAAFRSIERLASKTGYGKQEARDMIDSAFGAEHVRARYGKRFAELTGLTLNQAINFVRYELDEDRAVQARCGIGYTRVNPTKTKAVLIALRALQRFEPDFWPLAVKRATTPWHESVSPYRYGRPVISQAAE